MKVIEFVQEKMDYAHLCIEKETFLIDTLKTAKIQS